MVYYERTVRYYKSTFFVHITTSSVINFSLTEQKPCRLPQVRPHIKKQGRNSQNFLRKIRKIFVTFKYFYEAVIHRKTMIYEFSNS